MQPLEPDHKVDTRDRTCLHARVSDLHIVSRSRTGRLTNNETVKLGRVLLESSRTAHISYPDRTQTAVAIVHDYSGALTAAARHRLTDMLGGFDETILD